MSEAEVLNRLVDQASAVVNKVTGVQLGEAQRAMVRSRLQRRVMELGLGTAEAYEKYWQANQAAESEALVSLLTTHHTYFFRESSHFEFMLEHLIPAMVPKIRLRPDKTLRILSAACSKGHEAYSLAIFLKRHLAQVAPDLKFEIVGSDVDPASVRYAQNGVYPRHEVEQIPKAYLDGFWDFGTGDIAKFARLRKSVRDFCRFHVGNLLQPETVTANGKYDLIFCRNVFIYFKPADIERASIGLKAALSEGGSLIVGVSETLSGLKTGMVSMGPSTYGVPGPARAPQLPVAAAAPKGPIRVLCVDDSPTIHKMLDHVLGGDPEFKIVGHAMNGEEGLRMMASLSPDAITLDLQMPVLDGLGFLSATRGKSRPPVIIMSTLDRNEGEEGPQALRMGAQDYVAKPDAKNIERVKEELKVKLRTLTRASTREVKQNPVIAQAIQSIPARKTRVLVVDDSSSIRSLLSKIIGSAPDLEVVGTVDHPHKVKAAVVRYRPDVVTLDIHMPDQDGVSLLKELMPQFKVPVVMITSVTMAEGPMVLNALEAGAVDYIQKPSFGEIAEATTQIQEKIRAAAKAKVHSSAASYRSSTKVRTIAHGGDYEKVICIGSSTGGTEALKVVLTALPAEIPPIVIVQHIPPVFSKAFADRLNEICPFEVLEGSDGMELRKGRVIVAPGGQQMRVVKTTSGHAVSVRPEAPVNRHCPSVDVLFDSCAALLNRCAVGVILTGMGSDGAQGLLRMRQAGAETLAQDEASCVVFGMPRAAIQISAAARIVPLDRIATEIRSILSRQSKRAA